MRFYADENFPLDVVAELRNLGHDCLTALEDERAKDNFKNYARKRFISQQGEKRT